MSVSVMTITRTDDSLTTAMHGTNQTLHNPRGMFCRSCCSAVNRCGISKKNTQTNKKTRKEREGDSSGESADQVHPKDV